MRLLTIFSHHHSMCMCVRLDTKRDLRQAPLSGYWAKGNHRMVLLLVHVC